MNKKNIEDYKNEIHNMVDKIDNLPRIIRLFSYINKVFQIHMEESKED